MGFLSKGLGKNIKPSSMILKGGLATGKTITLKHYLDKIEKNFSNVVGVYINCKNHRTEYKIYLRIFEKLFNKKMINGGLSSTIIYEKIINYLVENNKILIVGLDDIESIKTFKDMNIALYNLARAHENNVNAKISIITVTQEKTLLLLDSNVSTIYHPNEVNFDSYTLSQIKNILSDRCRLAFYKGVISDKIINEVAKYTYDTGDLREGIRILEKAGKCAEYQGSKKILEKHFI